MTLRALLRQVLVAVGAVRREQSVQAAVLATHTTLLLQIAGEVQGPAPAGSVTITVGPVSEQPSSPPASTAKEST